MTRLAASDPHPDGRRLPASAANQRDWVRRIIVISDTQIPYHNKRQVDALIRFIGEDQPDEVIHIGDLMDYPQPSRWNKDTRREFEGSVKRDSDLGKRFLAQLRVIYDGPVGVHEGNHDRRPKDYLWRYAPALDDFCCFDIDKLLDFDGFGVTLLPDFYAFEPGWVSTHGHLGFNLSRIAGSTALNAAKKIGKSVVMGHTHRAGIVSESSGYRGKLQTVTGVEVGHLMDVRKADYLKNGWANWQSALGIVDISGRHVSAHVVPVVSDGSFMADGRIRR